MIQKNKNFKRKNFSKGKFHSRRNGSNGGSNGHNHNNHSRNSDSGFIDIRQVRRAEQAREKYLQMAKDALSGGDRVLAENFYQHADHYYRIILEAEKQGINLKTVDASVNNQNQDPKPASQDNSSSAETIGNVDIPAENIQLEKIAFLKAPVVSHEVKSENIAITQPQDETL